MTDILIIEDEHLAAISLQRMLAEIAPQYHVVAVLQSIEDAVEYFSTSPQPQLCFLDIHLADGVAFKIFDHVRVDCPIIFTTAYDQYAIEAFKVNSIDYLLKPINKLDLSRAIDKAQRLSSQPSSLQLSQIQAMLSRRQYQSCFLIPVGDQLLPLEVEQAACFYIDDRITHILTYDGRQLSIDKPLDLLTEKLDPCLFFRANRQFVVARKAISTMTIWPIGKLALTLSVETPSRIIVPKAKVKEFKDWYIGL